MADELILETTTAVVLELEVGAPGPPGRDGADGEDGTGGGSGGIQQVFVQDAAPDFEGVGMWWQTTGGDLTLWIEDGL